MRNTPSHKGRLVVRNLPYTFTQAQLQTLFSPFGRLKEVALPFDEAKKRNRGFAFVEFEHESSATKAIEKLNGSSLQKRVISVNLALNKTEYERTQKKTEGDLEFKPEAVEEAKEEKEIDKDATKPRPPQQSTFYKDRTLYVRNISYETEEEDLKEYFEQYGKVRYAKLVVDLGTGSSKGSGFVCYYKDEDAKKAMTALADVDEVLELDGRKLQAIPAVTREEAKSLAKVAEKTQDKRNLHLSKEGLIKPGTEAFETLTKEEIERRTNAARSKKDRLKNPNVFVSQTRLLIRNIPRSLDEKKLKKICREAIEASDEKLKRVKLIRQIKLMKDDTRTVEGKPRSRGFGFVDFREHEHALLCLRMLNNNPGVFGSKRKPIVEFALEDHRMLRIRDMKSKRTVSKKPRKEDKIQRESRGRRQREKKRLELTKTQAEEEQKQQVNEPFVRRKRSRNEDDVDYKTAEATKGRKRSRKADDFDLKTTEATKDPKRNHKTHEIELKNTESTKRQKRIHNPDDIDVEVMDFDSNTKKRKKAKVEDKLDRLVEEYRTKLQKKLGI